MLQWQRWHSRSLTFRKSYHIPHWPHTRDQYRHHQPQIKRSTSSILVTNKIHPSALNKTTGSPIRGGRTKAIRQYAVKSRSARTIRTPEPWINPRSLPESLDAHRRANREGITRDGVPAKTTRDDRDKSVKAWSQPGPWAGTKVLHIETAGLSQRHTIKYGGLCPPLLSEWRPAKTLSTPLRFPWLSRLATRENSESVQSAMQRLQAEIKAFEAYFSPSLSERKAAADAFGQIQEIVLQNMAPNTSIKLIGSRATGTESPISDLDINVQIPVNTDDPDRSESTAAQLRKLDTKLRQKQFEDALVLHAYIGKAHVPVVVGTHVLSGLEFQIQSEARAYDSLEIIKAYIAEYPTASALFKTVRQMLAMRGLTKGVLGGVTSYPLLIMIVTSLKLSGSHIAAGDIASQLLHFLAFWSEFDFEKHRVVLVAAGFQNMELRKTSNNLDPISAAPRVVPKQSSNIMSTHVMSFEDPADPFNDLGRNIHAIKHIQACLIEARHNIQQSIQDWDAGLIPNHVSGGRHPLLAWCLGGDYTAYEESRWQLHRYSEQMATL